MREEDERRTGEVVFSGSGCGWKDGVLTKLKSVLCGA